MNYELLRQGAKALRVDYAPCQAIQTFQSLDAIIEYLKENEDRLYGINAQVLFIGKTKKFLDITDFSGKRYAIYPGAWFTIILIDCLSPWNKDVLPPYTEEISIENVFGEEKFDKWVFAKRQALVADSKKIQVYKYLGLNKLIRDRRKLEERTVSICGDTQLNTWLSINPS